MSHVSKFELEVNDLAALEAACEPLGLEFKKDQKKYKWYGHSVGDYPIPAGFKASDLGKCEHAIGVKNNPNAYEVGVVKNPNGKGYTLLWDFWAGGYGLQEKVGKDGDKLKQHYNIQHAQRQFKKQGMQTKIVTLANGHMQVHATPPRTKTLVR
jgi:hypothetical protein